MLPVFRFVGARRGHLAPPHGTEQSQGDQEPRQVPLARAAATSVPFQVHFQVLLVPAPSRLPVGGGVGYVRGP